MPIEMTKISCNSCGGSLRILEGNKFCYCAYCGSSYYVDYGDTIKNVPQMRPTNSDERLSKDYITAKNNTLSGFLERAISNYALIDEGFCKKTANGSRIFFVVRNNRFFIIEQISQLHIYEGVIKRDDKGFLMLTKYLCTYSVTGRKCVQNDCSGIEKTYEIYMNDCGRLQLNGKNGSVEIRLLARYIPEYTGSMKIIEKIIKDV